MNRWNLLRSSVCFVAFVAQSASAFDPRPLHPTVRDRLGPVSVVLAVPDKPLVYDPLNANPSATLGAAAGNAIYDAQYNAPPGAGGAAAAGSVVGIVLAGYMLRGMQLEMQEQAAPMLSLAARLLDERRVRERAATSVERALGGVAWVGTATATVERSEDDASLLKARSNGTGAVLVVRAFTLFSKDGRQLNLFAQANLYHPELGPEFTQYKRKGKRTPVPWHEAALASTGYYRWSTPGWTALTPKSDADRAEEIAAVKAWFAAESAGKGKITLEKLAIERNKRLRATENNMQSFEMARARTMSAWEADGGESLAAQVDAALEKLLPKLVEDLSRLADADENPVLAIAH